MGAADDALDLGLPPLPPTSDMVVVAQTGPVPRSCAGRRALPGLLLLAALAGCADVPYAPGPSVIPSPSPAPRIPPAGSPIPLPAPEGSPVRPARGPEIELRGTLTNDDGQRAQLDAHVQLGDLGPVQRGGDEDRGSRRLAVRGTVTLTNSTNRINVPAASVLVVLEAGYPTRSEACRRLPPPDGMTWGRYCWYLLAAASPYGDHDDLVALQPGEQRQRALTTSAHGLGRLRVAETDVEEVSAAMSRPAVVVAATSPVNYDGTRLRAGCEMDAAVLTPTGAASPAQPGVTQNAVVAATKMIACQDFRYLNP